MKEEITTTFATSCINRMSKANDVTLSLKVMINKQKTKVLFAVADADFADVLFSFLTLPLGKIAKVLEDHYGDEAPSVGSLSNLYRSVANLDDSRFVNEAAKKMLLNPRSSFVDVCPNLKLDISDTRPTEFFTCVICAGYYRSLNISMYYASGSCDKCMNPLQRQMQICTTTRDPNYADGFTIKTSSFVICDDLRVVPYSTGYLQTLGYFGIGDTNGAELRNATFGIDQIIGLLKCCLLSETPLTDLILNNTLKPSSLAKKRKPEIPSTRVENKLDGNSKQINLKITVHKSTNKLLFAQADEDFVELLFSFLTIPLAGVESLLDRNSCLKSVDNLYTSIADAVDDKYFRSPALKKRLMNPKLPYGYTSVKQFLPLCEETAPALYSYGSKLRHIKSDSTSVPIFRSPKGPGNYVSEATTYMVTDDLTVTPFCVITAVTTLNRLKIPSSDVDEREVHIGLEEALNILKASLTSTFALSSGLRVNHTLKKKPKQEH